MSGKLGFTGLGAFKLGDSEATGVTPHVCFTYGGVVFWSFGGSAFFSYDETSGWTYEGEC